MNGPNEDGHSQGCSQGIASSSVSKSHQLPIDPTGRASRPALSLVRPHIRDGVLMNRE